MDILKKKILVAGCGSIGARHLRNLRTLGLKRFVLCDTDEKRLLQVSEGLESASLHSDYRKALDESPDAVFICTPSSLHLEMALEAAQRGIDLFIEKPLSHSMDGVAELVDVVRREGLVAMMAMCYRFHPVLLKVKAHIDGGSIGRPLHVNTFGGHYLPDWHPGEDYRSGYAARRDLGGGVLLTSIHGLDNVRWLFGEVEDLFAYIDRTGDLELDVEDIALAVMRLDSGIYVNFESDFLQRRARYDMVVTGTEGTMTVDVIRGVIDVARHESDGSFRQTVPFDVNTMYVKEAAHFLDATRTRKRPLADISEGVKTLELALRFRSAAGGKREETRLCAGV